MADDMEVTHPVGDGDAHGRSASLRSRLHASFLWRIWERLLEIEFVDRSIALAAKGFVSFFPLVIVVAAFMPERIRTSIVTALQTRLGMQGDALTIARQAFASADDIRRATGALGLVLTILFASSFTTALGRVYVRVWRRPRPGASAYWRGAIWLLAMLGSLALLGSLYRRVEGGLAIGSFAILALVVNVGLWWFTAWLMLIGEVRVRVLVPTGLITGVALGLYGVSASVWMPTVMTSNEDQFGFFGVALALVTWFSGAAVCILVGACIGVVIAEDGGRLGRFVRGGGSELLNTDARPSLSPPARGLGLRDAIEVEENDDGN